VFIWENWTKAKTSTDTWSGFLVQLRREKEFDWRFSRRKPSEGNFCEASPRPGWRVRPRTCVQGCACAVSIEKVFVSFKFPAPASKQSCASAASIEHVFVFKSFRLADPEFWQACKDPWESALFELVRLC